MNKLAVLLLLPFYLFSCQEATKKADETTAISTDSAAVADVIHGFYEWYDLYLQDETRAVDFIKIENDHYELDEALLEKYLTNINASGFVSSELLDGERAFYKACEALWQNEPADGPPIGMDADKYICAQDWEVLFWTKSPVRIESIGENRVAATLYGDMAGSPTERSFELKKEAGKWLLATIVCDMGIDVSGEIPSQAIADELAAFYTGTLPCADCDGITTLLTLNADERRTATLEQEYLGKENQRVVSNGTWTVAEDMITLNVESGSYKYQITQSGLVSLNADGTTSDSKSVEAYLLKRVMGE